MGATLLNPNEGSNWVVATYATVQNDHGESVSVVLNVEETGCVPAAPITLRLRTPEGLPVDEQLSEETAQKIGWQLIDIADTARDIRESDGMTSDDEGTHRLS
jgi:hypothetical protein